MKRLIIAAMLTLVPTAARAIPYMPLTTNPKEILLQDIEVDTPPQIAKLPHRELHWIMVRFYKDKYIRSQLASRLIMDSMLSKAINTIHKDKKLIKLNYGKPGYESLKISLEMAEGERQTYDHLLDKNPSLSLSAYIPHVEKMLAYRYQHRVPINKVALTNQKATIQRNKSIPNAAEHAAKEQRLIELFAQELRAQVFTAWNTNFAADRTCVIEIRLSPEGQIIGQPQVVKSSGNPKFDRAVIRAVEKAAPFAPPAGLSYSLYKAVDLQFNSEGLNHG